MIKLFRRVRQKLLSQKKFKNYLVYAIGEIVLVVIGILIALWLNNLNEARKNKKYERQYLYAIQENVQADISELEGHFRTDTVKLDAYTNLINCLSVPDGGCDIRSRLPQIYATFGYNWFEGQDHVFDDMRSSGKMNLIRSSEIKQDIQRYYKLFAEVIKQEVIHNAEIRKHMSNNSVYFNASALLEATNMERWNGFKESAAPDIVVLDNFDPRELMNNYSVMKTYQSANMRVRLELFQQAIELNQRISKFL